MSKRKPGSELKPAPGRKVPAIHRFSAKVERLETGCWKWNGCLYGSKANSRYGQFTLAHHVSIPAHIFAFQEFRYPVPSGLQLDHLCRNTWCVNPFHLQPVTAQINVLRGTSFAAINAKKTHCKHGHEFTPENTYEQHGGRGCKECKRIEARNRWRRLHWDSTRLAACS